MTEHILKTLKDKGLTVPEHHTGLLTAQWEAFQQMKKNLDQANGAAYDIALKHVPGGDQA